MILRRYVSTHFFLLEMAILSVAILSNNAAIPSRHDIDVPCTYRCPCPFRCSTRLDYASLPRRRVIMDEEHGR